MPGDARLLLDEAAKLEALMKDVTMIRVRRDAEAGKALVALRRRIAIQVADTADVVRPTLGQPNSTARSEYDRLHSTLLSRLALHQVNWPVVRLFAGGSMEDDAYRASAQMVNESMIVLIQWLRDTAHCA